MSESWLAPAIASASVAAAVSGIATGIALQGRNRLPGPRVGPWVWLLSLLPRYQRACDAARLGWPETRRQAIWISRRDRSLTLPIVAELINNAAAADDHIQRLKVGKSAPVQSAYRHVAQYWAAEELRSWIRAAEIRGAPKTTLASWTAILTALPLSQVSAQHVRAWHDRLGHLPIAAVPHLFAAGLSLEEAAALTPATLPSPEQLALMAALRGIPLPAGAAW